MGDTFYDPVDHMRTTRSHAGESLINVRSWPGYLLVFVGVVGVFRCLVAFGTGHSDRGVVMAAIAVVATALGLVWVVIEHRRVGGVESRWLAEHPAAPRQRPTS